MNMKENNIDFLKSIVIRENSSLMLQFVFDKVIENVPDQMFNLSTKEFLVYMYKETKLTGEPTEDSKFSAKILKTEEDVAIFAKKFKNDISELLNMLEFVKLYDVSNQSLCSEILLGQKDFRKKMVLFALNYTINEIKFSISAFFGSSSYNIGTFWSKEIEGNY